MASFGHLNELSAVVRCDALETLSTLLPAGARGARGRTARRRGLHRLAVPDLRSRRRPGSHSRRPTTRDSHTKEDKGKCCHVEGDQEVVSRRTLLFEQPDEFEIAARKWAAQDKMATHARVMSE
jgi:hypothetical protein